MKSEIKFNILIVLDWNYTCQSTKSNTCVKSYMINIKMCGTFYRKRN